jgi:hypothetical protein
MRMASLFTRTSLLKYFFIIGIPSYTVVLSFVQGTGYHDILCCQEKLYFKGTVTFLIAPHMIRLILHF